MEATQKIEAFFKAYQDRFYHSLEGDDDIDGTVDAFAECFIGADPSGVRCASNNDAFRETIPKGSKFYRDIGTVAMDIDHIEITKLNSVHFMAKVFWNSRYDQDGKITVIKFDVIYFLQQRNEDFKIFAYVTEDEQKALREHGLLGG